MKLNLKLHTILLTASLAFTVQAAMAAPVQTVNKIAAVAGKDAITVREWNESVNSARALLPKGSKVGAQELRQQTLLQLIDRSLLVQLAQRNGITASEAEIDQAIANIGKSRNISSEAVYAQVKKEGISREQLRRTVAENILMDKVKQREVMSRVTVSEAEIDQVLANRPAGSQAVAAPKITQYQTQHILIRIDGQTNARDAEAKIRDIQRRLRQGETFDSLARVYSQDPGSAAQGGSMGWVSPDELVPEFAAAMVKTPTGIVSQPVRTLYGWHLLRVQNVRQQEGSAVQQRNLIRQQIGNQKAGQVYNEWLKQLRAASYVDIRVQP